MPATSSTSPSFVEAGGHAEIDERGRVFVEVEQVRRAAFGAGEGRSDQLAEQRRRAGGPALQLRVRLGADPERVAAQLDELDQPIVGRGARAPELGLVEARPVARVELVAVTVALRHDRGAVGLGDLGALGELGDVGAETHRAAHVGDAALGVHQVDHRVRRGGVELAGVGTRQAEDVPGVVDRHHLEAEAEAEARDVVLAGVAGRHDLPLGASLAEPAGDHDAVELAQATVGEQALDLLGLDPLDLDLAPVVEPTVLERLRNRQVGVLQAHVLADDADASGAVHRLDAIDEDLPLAEVGVAGVDPKDLAHHVVESLLVQHERDLVEVPGVGGVHHRLDRDVAEVGDLALETAAEGLIAPHHDDVGLDASAPQLGDGVLGGLRLLLGDDLRRQGDVDVADLVAADVEPELPDRLEEREDLDVAHRAADLGDDDVDVVRREPVDPALDLVGDVRDHLDGLAEVVAAPLGRQHRRVDRSGGGVRVAGEVLVDEALVVPEVEVGLAPVVGDEHLAVLERVHGARVDVDVRVELLHRDAQAARLQQPPERRRRDALPEGRRHASRDEDVLGQRETSVCGSGPDLIDATTGAHPIPPR